MPSPRRTVRRRVVVAGILAVGWIAAAAIYLAMPDVVEDEGVSEIESSREYERQVEVIGGKGALLAAELDRWIAGLWQGKNHAYTVAFLTALVALAFYVWDRTRGSPSDLG